MAQKRNNRKRSSGWAYTKKFPHSNHPANYRRSGNSGDDIRYITFTHSDEVNFDDNVKVRTVPLADNISPVERHNNNISGKSRGENRSYAYPKVYVGKRSALGKETNEFETVDFDKKRIDKMFEVFPREVVPVTGGKTKFRKRKNKKSRK